MWQKDMHAVIRFDDSALRMSVLPEAELPPNQPDVVGSVTKFFFYQKLV